MRNPQENADPGTVQGFGNQWSTFDYSDHENAETQEYFRMYFRIFPWSELPPNAVGFDAGCGTGRWARLVAPRVGTLHCVDASEDALGVARRNLTRFDNCRFHNASLADIPLPDGSADFGYSLGVLHHIPDTQAGLNAIARKLKPGAPLLVYIYYALENRSALYRTAFALSEVVRQKTAELPYKARLAASQAVAASVYWPLARSARLLERLGFDVSQIPLSSYRNRSFYIMRTDAHDRFGTGLIHRYTKDQIASMMEKAGLRNIEFAEGFPYWVAVGRRAG